MLEGRTDDPRFCSAFVSEFLPHYARSPVTGFPTAGPRWHTEFTHEVFAGLGTGQALAVMAARGFGKSVAGLVLVLASLALKRKSYIWLVSDSSSQAKLLMASVVAELDNNADMLATFPHLARAYDSRGRPVADRDDSIVLANGLGGARLEAIGAGQKLRGRRQSQHRPDLVICDDLESEDSVNTRAQIDKMDAWFSSALLGALGPGCDVLVVGTALHSDSLLSRLQKRDGWTGRTYPALTDPTNMASSTWPEIWPAARLEEARKRMGSLAFSREVLLNPISTDTQLFPRTHYRYRPTRGRLLEADPGEITARVRIAVDPAISERASADFTAIAVTAQLGASNEHDVLDVHLFRASGKKIADRVVAEYERWRRYNPIVLVEAVQAQSWLAQALKDEGIPVTEIRPQRDKVIRAEPVAVLYEQGAVWHSPHLKDGPFEEQLETMPSGVHDDGVDAVVYAISDAATRKSRPRITNLGDPGLRARLEREIAEQKRQRGE